MALERLGAELLLHLRRAGTPFGRVLTIGRQSVALTADDLVQLAARSPVELPASVASDQFAEAFFERLGATGVESIDLSDYEGCTHQHDLNTPVPERLYGRFDLVFDGGSLEHIFDFPTAARNLMQLVAPGGTVVTVNPADHLLGHGFYQFSPELFFRLFSPSHGFGHVRVFLGEANVGRPRFWEVVDPASAGLRTRSPSARPLYVMVAATRAPEGDVPPTLSLQQSDYARRWDGEGADGGAPSGAGAPGLAGKLKAAAKSTLPEAWVTGWQRRAIERRHAAEAGRALRHIPHLD